MSQSQRQLKCYIFYSPHCGSQVTVVKSPWLIICVICTLPQNGTYPLRSVVIVSYFSRHVTTMWKVIAAFDSLSHFGHIRVTVLLGARYVVRSQDLQNVTHLFRRSSQWNCLFIFIDKLLAIKLSKAFKYSHRYSHINSDFLL